MFHKYSVKLGKTRYWLLPIVGNPVKLGKNPVLRSTDPKNVQVNLVASPRVLQKLLAVVVVVFSSVTCFSAVGR